jgi:hypothetical protein
MSITLKYGGGGGRRVLQVSTETFCMCQDSDIQNIKKCLSIPKKISCRATETFGTEL